MSCGRRLISGCAWTRPGFLCCNCITGGSCEQCRFSLASMPFPFRVPLDSDSLGQTLAGRKEFFYDPSPILQVVVLMTAPSLLLLSPVDVCVWRDEFPLVPAVWFRSCFNVEFSGMRCTVVVQLESALGDLEATWLAWVLSCSCLVYCYCFWPTIRWMWRRWGPPLVCSGLRAVWGNLDLDSYIAPHYCYSSGNQRIVLARLGFDLWRTSHDTYYGLLGASRPPAGLQLLHQLVVSSLRNDAGGLFCGPWKQMTSAVEELCLGPSWIWSGSAYSYCGPGRFVQMAWSQLYLKAENGGT